MVNVYIKERINDQTTICAGGVTGNTTYLGAVRVRAPATDIELCSWARHFTLTVPLSIQVNKWVLAALMLGITLPWTSIPSRGDLGESRGGSRNSPSHFL